MFGLKKKIFFASVFFIFFLIIAISLVQTATTNSCVGITCTITFTTLILPLHLCEKVFSKFSLRILVENELKPLSENTFSIEVAKSNYKGDIKW